MTDNDQRDPSKRFEGERMKVAFLSYEWPEYCLRLVSALAQDVRVCLLGPRPWGAQLHRLDQVVSFQPFDVSRFRQPLRQLRTIRSVLRAINTFDPDVIHVQQGHFWLNLALPLLRRYPLVITIMDPRHHLGDRPSQKTPQWIVDFGFRQATRLIVHSTQMAQMVSEELGISDQIIDVVPVIQHGDDTAQKQVKEEENLILFFGRIWEYKGLEYLIKAEPLITAQVPEARIVIAGQGEDFARYRQMMVHPDKFIVHNERVPDDKRARLFRQASVVVLPYVEASDSGVIPVAYTFGKPVIATAVGGLPEQVEDGHTGYLVPPRDERALAEAVIRLFQDPELCHRLGANAKQKVETEWSPRAVAQRTLSVYVRAIDSVRLTAKRKTTR